LRPFSRLASQLAHEFRFVHPIFKGFAAVDKHDWDFVIELPPQLPVAIYIHFLPGKSSAARQLAEAFLYDLAEVTAFAGIHHDLSRLRHAQIVPLALLLQASKKKACREH